MPSFRARYRSYCVSLIMINFQRIDLCGYFGQTQRFSTDLKEVTKLLNVNRIRHVFASFPLPDGILAHFKLFSYIFA